MVAKLVKFERFIKSRPKLTYPLAIGVADMLRGGLGDDVFVIADGSGGDLVADFDSLSAGEKIDLHEVGAITDFTDRITNHISQEGVSCVIVFSATDTVILEGVQLSDLDNLDFLF